MRPAEVFRKGSRLVGSNLKFVFLFWFANASVAFVMSISLYYMLIDHLEFSLMSERISEGFQHIWLIQFLNNYKNNLGEIPFTIYGFVGIYALLQTFFSGGLLSVFNKPKKNHMVDFFYGGVQLWWRFTKIVIIALAFYAAAFLINDLIGYLLALAFKNTELELVDFILRSLRYLLLIFFILIISIMTDYIKTAVCIKESGSIFSEIKSVIILVKNNFSKIAGIFLIISVAGLSAGVVYNVIGTFIPHTPSYFLILAFILQQLLIIFRILIRMLFYSTEVILFNDIIAEVITADAQNLEVKI